MIQIIRKFKYRGICDKCGIEISCEKEDLIKSRRALMNLKILRYARFAEMKLESSKLKKGKIAGCESEIYRLVRRNRWFPKRNGTCRT